MIKREAEVLIELWKSAKEIFGPLGGLNAFGIVVIAVLATSDTIIEWIYRSILTLIRLCKPTVEFLAGPLGSSQKLLWLGMLLIASLVVVGFFETRRL